MISEVREALEELAAAGELTDPHAVVRAIAAGTRRAQYDVLTLDDLDDIADAIPRQREEPW